MFLVIAASKFVGYVKNFTLSSTVSNFKPNPLNKSQACKIPNPAKFTVFVAPLTKKNC